MLKLDQLDPETKQRVLAMLREQGQEVALDPGLQASPSVPVVEAVSSSPAPAVKRTPWPLKVLAWTGLALLTFFLLYLGVPAIGNPIHKAVIHAMGVREEQVWVGDHNPNYDLKAELKRQEEELRRIREAERQGQQPGQAVRQSVQQVQQKQQPLDWRNTGVDWAALEKRLEPYVFRITGTDGRTGTAFYTGDAWRRIKEAEKQGWAGSGSAVREVYTAYHLVKGLKADPVLGDVRFRLEQVKGGKAFFDEAWWYGGSGQDSDDVILLPTFTDGKGFIEQSPSDYYENAPILGNAYVLKPGDLVLILGNPLNLWDKGSHPGPISTVGKVLAVDIPFKEKGMLTSIKHGLKIQADIAPGNSGSPVFNSQGEVVGMVVAGGEPEPDPVSGVNRIVAYAVMFPLR